MGTMKILYDDSASNVTRATLIVKSQNVSDHIWTKKICRWAGVEYREAPVETDEQGHQRRAVVGKQQAELAERRSSMEGMTFAYDDKRLKIEEQKKRKHLIEQMKQFYTFAAPS